MADNIELMRQRVIDIAIQGELVEQRSEEGSAKTLLDQIQMINENKPLQNIDYDEISSGIPESWEWIKFGDIANFQSGKTPSRGNKSYWDNGTYPWISISDIKDGEHLSITKEQINEKAKDEVFKGNFSPKGTLIMSFKLSIGKMAILDVDAFHNEAIISIYPKYDDSKTIRNYLYYIMNGLDLLKESKGAIKGATLNKKSLNNILVPLPPLAEQKRIIAKIESLFTVIDQIGERKQDSLAIIEKIRQTSLQNAIMGQLVEQNENDEPASDLVKKIQAKKEQLIKEKKIKNENILLDIKEENIPFEIPENWNWIRLGDLLGKIGSGSTPKGGVSVYVETGIPFIRSQNVYNDGLRLKNVAYITEETNNSKSGSQVFAGDILLNITGASIGRCALVPDDFEIGNVNQHVLINRPIDTRIRQYLHIALTSPYISNEIMSLQKGGTKEGLSATNAKLLKIPFPPLSEQQRIVEKLDQIMDICDQMEAIFDGSSQTNRALKVAE